MIVLVKAAKWALNMISSMSKFAEIIEFPAVKSAISAVIRPKEWVVSPPDENMLLAVLVKLPDITKLVAAFSEIAVENRSDAMFMLSAVASMFVEAVIASCRSKSPVAVIVIALKLL